MGCFISKIAASTEFWSAVVGAIVGGLIALGAQMLALRDAWERREKDHQRTQQALAASLLFKMMRIHSTYATIHKFFENCFAEAAKKGMQDEPWRFYTPLASLPKHVDFSSEEMGMLLQQEDDDLFNSTLQVDVVHNAFVDALQTLNTMQPELMERIPPDLVEGELGEIALPEERLLPLRPAMIKVNSLVEQLRNQAEKDATEAGNLLDRLQALLRDRLKLAYSVGPASNADE